MAKPKRKYAFVYRFLLRVLIFVAVVFGIFTWVIAPYRMVGNNMFSNVKDGDLCVFYRLAKFNIGDAVLYKDAEGVKHVGRIVAFPGQKVDFPDEGGYLVNEYSPSEQIPYETYKSEESKIRYPVKLKKGEYFIMNDLRSDTADSREAGPVLEKDMIGSLVFIFRRRGL